MDLKGLEPLTFSMPLRRAPNCATGPQRKQVYRTRSCGGRHCWQISASHRLLPISIHFNCPLLPGFGLTPDSFAGDELPPNVATNRTAHGGASQIEPLPPRSTLGRGVSAALGESHMECARKSVFLLTGFALAALSVTCLLYTSPSPRD